MSPDVGICDRSPESGCVGGGAGLKTELTLGLPGAGAAEAVKSGSKRRYSETVDFKLGTSSEDGEVSVSTPPPTSK